MSSKREIAEGVQEQGEDEEIIYTLTIPASWGTPTGSPTIKGYSYDVTTGTRTDVTSTIMPVGTGSIAAQVITLPKVKSLTAGVTYRIEMKFTISEGGVREAFAWIKATI